MAPSLIEELRIEALPVPFSLPLAVSSFSLALPANEWEGAMQAGGEFSINTGKL